MNDWTRALIDALHTHHERLRAAVLSVPEELRSRRPEPERWSAAEVVEHLAITEQRIVKLFAVSLASITTTIDPATPPSVVVDRERLLDRTRPVHRPDSLHPTGAVDASVAMQQLEATRLTLLKLVEESDGLDLRAVTRPHPVLGELDVFQWLLTIALHEERHAMQIRETGEMLAASH